jgi:hypothetical protein
MSKERTPVQLVIFFVSFIILLWSNLFAVSTENINYGIGNLSITGGGEPLGYYLQIPKANFAIFFSGNDIMTFDINSMKIKGGKTLSHGFNQRSMSIIPDKVSGLNIFYYISDKAIFGRIHIESDGRIRDEIILLKAIAKPTSSACVPERSEVWAFTDKILRLDTIDETWTEFDYPQGWDSDFGYVNVYNLLTYDSIIGIAKGNTINDYQAFILDTITGESKLISADPGFFAGVKDIKIRKEHPNQYIFMLSNEIYSYNSQTGAIELLMQDFGVSAKNIMQNDKGNYLYIIGNKNVIYILDLNNKTVETHIIPLKEGFVFWFSGSCETIYDSKRNKIIANISKSGFDEREFAIIDLQNFSVEALEGEYKNYGLTWLFLEDDNKIFCSSGSSFYMIDIDTGDVKNSISLIGGLNSWNIIDDFDKPVLLDYASEGFDFVRILPNYCREIYNVDFEPTTLCQFPDGKNGIIEESIGIPVTETSYRFEYNYYRYDFENRQAQKIELLYDSSDFITDSVNNQIIGLGETLFIENNNVISRFVVQFISPDFSVESWIGPNADEMGLYWQPQCLIDNQNNIIWLSYYKLDTGDNYFYKLSTTTKTQIDSFIITSDVLNQFNYTVNDPTGKYLYFINETNSGSIRELVIYDIDKRIVTGRIVLQENVQNELTRIRVIPGIIPIPEKNKLFLWDHYSALSIDTNSWEVLYGEVKDNPRAFNNNIQGIYIEEKNIVQLIDFSIDYENGELLKSRGLEIDLDTGNIVAEFDIPSGASDPHFTKDKSDIIYKNFYDSKIYVQHLDPAWSEPATIEPSTSYVQFGSGDNAKFTVNIKNPYNFEQKATAYIWLYTPDGNFLFFDGAGLTTQIKGISLTLPLNLDVTADILTFTMPSGVPEGFYNYNAVFINENGDRGPIGTWNFYVKD